MHLLFIKIWEVRKRTLYSLSFFSKTFASSMKVDTVLKVNSIKSTKCVEASK